MRKHCYKGQHLTEFILISLLLGVAALSFLSPYAVNISNIINSSVPVKSNEASIIADLNSLFDTDSAEFAKSLDIIKQSSNPEAQHFAENVTEIINDLGKIEQGKGDEVSEENFKAIIAYLKTTASPANKTETSGSVANILVSDLSKSSASNEVKAAAAKIKDILASKEICFSTGSSIVNDSNNTSHLLFKQITSGVLPATVLKFDGSPVTDADLVNDKIINTYNTYFYVSESVTNPTGNFINNFFAIDNASQQYKLSVDLQQKYDNLVISTKKSLSIR